MQKLNSFPVVLLSILVPTAMFYILNVFTPFWYDDFAMACYIDTFEGEKTRLNANFDDIINSTINMYKTHQGRSIVDFLGFVFMFLENKSLFNICNALVYGIFIFLMCFHVVGSVKEIRPVHFLCANALLWLFLLSYGQNMLWLTGALNYLWTGTIVLLFLVPFKKHLTNRDYSPPLIVSTIWLLVGILCGWSIENAALGTFWLLAWYFFLKYKRNERIFLFEVLGAIGFLFGLFGLLGSFIFFNSDGSFGLLKVAGNVAKVIAQFVSKDLILLTIVIVLSAELVYFRKKKMPLEAIFFLVIALGSLAAMVIPGYFRGRSTFITNIFLIMTVMSVFFHLSKYIDKRFVIVSYIALAFAFLPSFVDGVNSIFGGHLLFAAREHYILQEKEKGNLNVKVKTPVPAIDSHSGLYDGVDVQHDSTYSNVYSAKRQHRYIKQNSSMAVYYGLESLTGILTADILSEPPAYNSIIYEPIKYYFGIAENGDKDLFTTVYEDWK
jgi:hypothetical protein